MKQSFIKKYSRYTTLILCGALVVFFFIILFAMHISLNYQEIISATPATESTSGEILSQDIQDINRLNNRIMYRLFTVGGISLMLLLILAYFLSMFISKQLFQPFIHQINQIICHKGLTEYTELSQIKQEYENTYLAEQKLIEERKKYTDYTAHELRNFLTLLSSKIDVLGKDDPLNTLNMIRSDVNRFKFVIDDLMSFANLTTDEDKLDDVDLLLCVATSVDEYLCAGYNIKLEYDEDKEYIVVSKQAWIERLIVNLLQNAIYHGKENESIDVSLSQDTDLNLVALSVKNKGDKISEEDIHKIFTPYYRKNSKGKGLGLAFVKQVADRSHATVKVTSSDDETIFTINFHDREVYDENFNC